MKLSYQYTLEAGSISISKKQTLSSAVYDDTDIKNRLSALEGDVSEMKTVDENYGNKLDALAYVANTGNYADLINKPDLSTYVTKDQLSSCGYITINDIPTIQVDYVTEERISQMGYITGAQLSACGYLTSHQSLDGYVNKTDLNNVGYITTGDVSAMGYITGSDVSQMGYITINDIPSVDLSAYVSKTELSNAGYITSIPSEYVTEAELSACGYLTSHQSLDGYVSKTELSNAGYITSADIPSVDLSSYVSKADLNNAGYITSIPSEYVTEAELTACGYLTSHQSLDDYVTKSMLSSQSYLTQHQSLADYVTKDDLSNAGYITSVAPVDLSGYVSKTELSNCGYLTEHQDLSAYAPKSYVVEYVATYAGGDMSDYLPLTGGEITGPLYVSYQQTNNTLYGFKSYSHIVAGDENKTTPAFLASKRYCANGVGSYINMASFFVNGDGRAKFTHKSTAGGGSDDAFMCFNAYGFKLAYSGAAGTAASTEYDIIHSGNISEYVGGGNVTIDEDIIPKENNTYNLGSSTYQYASVNTYSVGAYNSNMYIDTAHGIGFNINGSNRVYIGNSQFRPLTDNLMNLGLSSARWKATYTAYLYCNVDGVSTDIGYYLSYNLSGIETLLANI